MSHYTVRFITRLELVVDVDEEDEEVAADVAWERANDYLSTVVGDHRSVRAFADLDGIGADDVEALDGAR